MQRSWSFVFARKACVPHNMYTLNRILSTGTKYMLCHTYFLLRWRPWRLVPRKWKRPTRMSNSIRLTYVCYKNFHTSSSILWRCCWNTLTHWWWFVLKALSCVLFSVKKNLRTINSDHMSMYLSGFTGPTGGHDGRRQRSPGGPEPQLRHSRHRWGWSGSRYTLLFNTCFLKQLHFLDTFYL